MGSEYRYFIVYKPFGTLCQFTKEVPQHVTLRDTFPDLPEHVYPVGRLDQDSEGLLLVTNDNNLKARIISPDKKVRKLYLAQVEGEMTEKAAAQLRSGVLIRVRKHEFRTSPAGVRILDHAPELPEREPPIRFRASIPTSWVEIGITEGKNRQVRRMCAKVGFPVLRLVRKAIGGLALDGLMPGEMKEMDREALVGKIFG